MKSKNDPPISFGPLPGTRFTHRIWLCVAVFLTASVPSAIANRHGQPQNDGGDLQMQALEGSGGGEDVLEEEEAEKPSSFYRPWKTRFDLQPFDLANPKFMQPENRMAYRRFYAANPQLALAPNSRDRDAQSTVVMIFGMTALGAIIGAILIVDQLQVLGADELNLVNYQVKMMRVVLYAAVPWLLLGGWLLSIFLAFVNNPMRYSSTTYHWQCDAMVWFILVTPAINALYFTAHALWISKVAFSVEKQAPMGRMFSLGSDLQEEKGSDSLSRVFNIASHTVTRHVLLLLEAGCAVFGFMLITFRWGANSQFCHPEVYWTTTALVVTVTIIIVFSALTFLFSVIIRAFSVSPWIQDFCDSFKEARLLAKMAREEKLAKPLKSQNEDFEEWVEVNADFEEDRQRHEAIMQEHASYLAAVSDNAAAQECAIYTQPLGQTAFEEDTTETRPLVVWDDDESEANTIEPSPIESTPRDIPGVAGNDGSERTVSPAPVHYSIASQPAYIMSSPMVMINSAPLIVETATGFPPILSGPLNYDGQGSPVGRVDAADAGQWGEQPQHAEMAGRYTPMQQPSMTSSGMLPPGYITGPPSLPPTGSTLQPSSFRQMPVMSGSMLPSGYIEGRPSVPPAIGTLPPGTLPPGTWGTLPPGSLQLP